MCTLPTPSSLYRFRSSSWGRNPPALAPVESCRYRPTNPLLLPSPPGWAADRELSSKRALSHALAPTITTLPRPVYSCNVGVFTNDTPLASPRLSVSTSRTMAWSIALRLPVFIAGITRQDEEEKSPYTLHARPHCPQ